MVVPRESVRKFYGCFFIYKERIMEGKNYKETLNMPHTGFEMRGNLPKKEPKMMENWQTENQYEQLLAHHKGQKSYVLHDGPPYANGNLHCGTAMNRSIKDFIVRTHAMNGYYTPFFPGWDTHGLPIENAVQKLGVNRKEVSAAEFRKKCEAYAKEQVATQMATMKRLGTVADYDHPYITLQKGFEARQIKCFAKMALSGMIYQGLKPIYWSPYQETAIADSEIVYIDRKDPTIFVAFDVLDGKGVLTSKEDRFVIWTTTPWTIPANLAICLNEAYDYALVKTEKGNLVVLASKVDELLAKFNLDNLGVIKTMKGKELEGITVSHPFYPQRPSVVILGNHVTDEDGTGCVHTAPGHGLEDFYVGLKYGLKAFCPVDDKGCLTEEAGEDLAGKFVLDANKDVVTKLDELGNLMALEWITHAYPHDERLKKPVIFRATVQWFASIDKIKEDLLKAVENVNWLNSFGQVRLSNMIKDRSDWCISRQRLWGVPIPIIYCEDGSPIIDEVVFDHIADLIEQYGSNVWFEKEAKDLLPQGYTNEKSPNGIFTKEKDIMDVWFDSGSSWNELTDRGYSYPCDLYFEGSDQYRGWFNSSLSVSVATNGVAPYKAVLSHGYVCDSKGEAMHKSAGNVVNPLEIIDKYGADIFRLWAATSDYKQDMRIGDENLKQVADQYKKVRNTFKFLLGNLNEDDFNPTNNLVEFGALNKVNQAMLMQLKKLNSAVIDDYMNYNYIAATSKMTNFMITNLSNYYCSFTKDILYIEAKDDTTRRGVQTVLWHVCDTLVRLWAPILVFTMEEVWSFFTNKCESSVHYTEFNALDEIKVDEQLLTNMEICFEVRSSVLKALEQARANQEIKDNQQAQVVLGLPEATLTILSNTINNLKQWLIVSKVTTYASDNVEIKVGKAEGHICPRCWNVEEEVDEAGLCIRCHHVLNK